MNKQHAKLISSFNILADGPTEDDYDREGDRKGRSDAKIKDRVEESKRPSDKLFQEGEIISQGRDIRSALTMHPRTQFKMRTREASRANIYGVFQQFDQHEIQGLQTLLRYHS
jgi:hypothetical protein